MADALTELGRGFCYEPTQSDPVAAKLAAMWMDVAIFAAIGPSFVVGVADTKTGEVALRRRAQAALDKALDLFIEHFFEEEEDGPIS